MIAHTWFETHHERLVAAQQAIRTREAWAGFQESPSSRYHPEGAKEAGQRTFEATLGQRFVLQQPQEAEHWVGDEQSPYTGEALGITYPVLDRDRWFAGIDGPMQAFAAAGTKARIGCCLEILARLEAALFVNTPATMHTTGQGFMMAHAGNGANSLDRGLEGLAMTATAMDAVPTEALYERAFGHGTVRLLKRYRIRPRGVAVVFSCGTYPAWNAYPALFANLAAGNPVVLKPHPRCVLPMALAVRTCQEVLLQAGFSPELVVLAPDAPHALIGEALLTHPAVRIIDFTGGQTFGRWIETNCPQARVYTETSGCNAVVLESVRELDPVLAAIATSVCLFSAQMCTAAQNIFVPATGLRTASGVVPYEEVVSRFLAQVERLVSGPHAAALCGALFDDGVVRALDRLAASAPDAVLRRHAPVPNPAFPQARTRSPLVLQLEGTDRRLAQQETFGPVAFLIRVPDAASAVEAAAADASQFGSIANYAYTTDAEVLDALEERFARAGASVGVNLIGQQPINFAAAYSDYHVTGLNPAGTATLTDLAFVADRFGVQQTKVEVP